MKKEKRNKILKVLVVIIILIANIFINTKIFATELNSKEINLLELEDVKDFNHNNVIQSNNLQNNLRALNSFNINLTPNIEGYGSVYVDWSEYSYIDKNFKVYRSSDGGRTYETVGIDYTLVDKIRCLQIYPIASAANQLKTWMETNGYGKGIIKMDSVYIDNFNSNPNGYLKDANGNWKYDVIFFGTADANNKKDLNYNASVVTEAYIKSGRGCIFGHDTIYYPQNPNFCRLAPYFNISVTTSSISYTVQPTVEINKKGLFTNYPWYIGEVGTRLTIPPAHPLTQYARGTIWLKFVGGSYSVCNNFYLTTYNNCAMIQTGHSGGASTSDERKILANLIFYLNQLTFSTHRTIDSSAQDVANPNAPSVGVSGNKFNFSAEDNGSTYHYYVESYKKDDTTQSGLLDRSVIKSTTVTTGVRSYRYIYDNNSSTTVTLSNGTSTESNIDVNLNYKYLHVAAVDGAGNIGKTTTINLSDMYTVKYNGNGATSGTTGDSNHMFNVAQNLTPNGFEKKYIVTFNHNYEGSENVIKEVAYTFKNWNTAPTGKGTKYNNTQSVINLTSTAGRVINMYAMWEDSNVSYLPEREGYSFGGWYLDSECTAKVTEDEYTPTKNTTLYAKWKRDYTITVDNDKKGHTYNSYQVFQGDYSEKEEKRFDENGEEKIVKIPILSNIEWSEELQKEAVTGKTHGDKIIEALQENEKDRAEEEKLYTNCKTAEDVAEILKGKPNNGDAIKEFTNIVGKYILDNSIPITKGTSTLIEGNIDKNYKIPHLEPGYYIVIDAEVDEKDDAYSRYLINTVQDVIMEPKTSIPSLNKKVKGNNLKTKVEGTGTSSENPAQYIEDEKRNTATYKLSSENYNADDYDIEFELKSYIPDLEGFNTYKYEIVDILDKGFDYDRNSIKVMLGEKEYPKTREKIIKISEWIDKIDRVENYIIKEIQISEENYELYKNYFEEERKEYPENFAKTNYGKTLILIEINDLIEQMKDGILAKGQDVIIKYKAKLNGKGETGNTPNINEAYLKYSNDPYHAEKETQTTSQTTYTYTIDLNLSKIAEIKKQVTNQNILEGLEQLKYLEGAEFEIYDKPQADKSRALIATVTTNELGQALYSSLGVGTYYLKETKSPEGYNRLKEEVEIEVKATCDEYGTIIWEVEEKNDNKLFLVQIGIKEGTTISEIKLQVENTEGFQLPVTGGKGTLIFTLIGISLMLVSLKCLKSKSIWILK